jgi:regulator of chromosome condensation
MGRPGRKRRFSQTANQSQSQTNKSTSSQLNGSQRAARKKFELNVQLPNDPTDRCLTCGTGEQLGHPGRDTTKKPRAVDTFDEGTRFIQAFAGGVHSLLLTAEGVIYSCGVNEKGVVPVRGLDAGDLTDEFTEIEFSEEIQEHGKIIQITAGASFAAALTDLGSVIAWGNLRDSQGDFTAHPQFTKMQTEPVVIIKHDKIKIVKIAAGENHLIMLSHIGQVLTFGEATQGQLGRTSRPGSIRQNFLADETGSHLLIQILERGKLIKFIDIFAGGNWSIFKTEDERIFACGLNNFAQLGMTPSQGDAQLNGMPDQGEVRDDGQYTILRPKHIRAFNTESKWTHISGVTHLVLRNENGEVYSIGKNIDNILGLGTWTGQDDNEHWRYDTLQRVVFPDDVKIAGVSAATGCTIAWTEDGDAYAFGFDGSGQLGLGIADDGDKIVPTPRKINSLHLTDYKISMVSVADQHSIFLAKHV